MIQQGFQRLEIPSAFGEWSYGFNKDYRGNPPPPPRQFGSALAVPDMVQPVAEVEKLIGLDVEKIYLDKVQAFRVFLRKQGFNGYQLEQILAEKSKIRLLVGSLASNFYRFYKDLNNKFLTPDEKQKMISQKLNSFQNLPAGVVRLSDMVAETALKENVPEYQLPELIDTLSLRGLVPISRDPEMEQLLNIVRIPTQIAEETRRAVVGESDSEPMGTGIPRVGGADGAPLRPIGLVPSGSISYDPETYEEAINLYQSQLSTLIEFQDNIPDAPRLIGSTERLINELQRLQRESMAGASPETPEERMERERQEVQETIRALTGMERSAIRRAKERTGRRPIPVMNTEDMLADLMRRGALRAGTLEPLGEAGAGAGAEGLPSAREMLRTGAGVAGIPPPPPMTEARRRGAAESRERLREMEARLEETRAERMEAMAPPESAPWYSQLFT